MFPDGDALGIDDFQANRSPDLSAVVAHCEKTLQLQLTAAEKADPIEYLKSL